MAMNFSVLKSGEVIILKWSYTIQTVLCVWFLSHNIMSVRFIQAVNCSKVLFFLLMYIISLYDYLVIYLPIILLIYIEFFLVFLFVRFTFMNKAKTLLYDSFCRCKYSFLLIVELLGYKVMIFSFNDTNSKIARS